jgi:NADH-quinone oxidoreductase subunit M
VSSVGKALFELVPYVVVFLACALMPRRQGTMERMALGAIGAITAAFTLGLWHGGGTMSIGAGGWVEWPHLLNLIVFLPLLGAVFVLFLPRQSPSLLRGFSLGILVADFLASLVLLGTPMRSGWHHQFIGEWLPSWGIRYHVAVDGISLWLLLLTTFTTPLAFYAACGAVRERVKDFCFAALLLHAAILGAYVALDLFLFYAFSELALVAMAFVIGVWGGRERKGAAFKFFLYAFAGSAAMLAAILYLVWSHQQAAGYLTFDYLALSHLALPRAAAWSCFFAFAVAFAVKVPLFPFHTWLADAFEEAPTFAVIILSAVMLKLGAYGYLRFCMGMFAGPAWQAGVTFAGLSVVCGVIWGALGAIRQGDIRRLIAYASLAQMGYIMLGVFAATVSSLEGAIFQMLSHGISTCALFLLVAIMHERCQSHQMR